MKTAIVATTLFSLFSSSNVIPKGTIETASALYRDALSRNCPGIAPEPIGLEGPPVDPRITLLGTTRLPPNFIVEHWYDEEYGVKFLVMLAVTGDGVVTISDPDFLDGMWFGWSFAAKGGALIPLK